MTNVSFKVGLKSEWQALSDAGKLDQNALYFCTDTLEIFKGSLLFGTSKLENLTESSDAKVEFYGGSATELI